MKLKFKRFSGHSRTPIRATSGSAGYDLFSTQKVELKPNSIQKISTDIDLKTPKNHYGRICTCSSYTLKYTGVGAVVVNFDYRGNISIVFFKFLNKFYQVEIGDRIA